MMEDTQSILFLKVLLSRLILLGMFFRNNMNSAFKRGSPYSTVQFSTAELG